jgi:hypothetical protein
MTTQNILPISILPSTADPLEVGDGVAASSEIVQRSANYTSTEDDLGKTLRFSNGTPTVGPVSVRRAGQFLYIRNSTGADITIEADAGVILNGDLKIANNETLALHVIRENEYDAIGGSV